MKPNIWHCCWHLKLLVEHAPWIFGPSRTRFSALGLDARLAVLQRMHESPIYFRRIAFLSMRTILTMGYLAHPDVMAAMRMVHDAAPFERRAAARAEEVRA